MRVQFRYEISEHVTAEIDQYAAARTCVDQRVLLLDQGREETWRARDARGEYLMRVASVYFIWNPEAHSRIAAESGGVALKSKKKEGSSKSHADSLKALFGGVSVSSNIALTLE